MKTKTIAMIIAMVMIVVCMVSGTLAWLTDSTSEVKNTFSTAGIDIELTETWNYDSNNDETNDSWKAQMIPGFSYAKDPKVTVKANSVDCYLFVKFEEKNSASTYLTYTSTLTVANGWTQGTGAGTGGNGVPTNVWFREVTSSPSDQSWDLLSGNTITVKGDAVTKDNITTAASAELVYTAYATQLYESAGSKFAVGTAWTNASTSGT